MIRPGDAVVCVDITTPNNAGETLAASFLRLGACYRVAAVFNISGCSGLALIGVTTKGKLGFHAFRFRKIDKADEKFTEIIRDCRPITVNS